MQKTSSLNIGLVPASNQPSSSSKNSGTIVKGNKTYKVSFFKDGNPIKVKNWQKEAEKVIKLLSTNNILPKAGEKIKTNHTTGTVKRIFTCGKSDEIISIKPELVTNIKFAFEVEKKSVSKKENEKKKPLVIEKPKNKLKTKNTKKKKKKKKKRKKKKEKEIIIEDNNQSIENAYFGKNEDYNNENESFKNNITFEDITEKDLNNDNGDDQVINIYE
jgi:hypothetical protein